MFRETIETDSLELRRLAPDTTDVFALYDPFAAGREATVAVFEYIPREPLETPKDAHDWLADAAREWEEREGAKYGVRSDDALVGLASLKPHWDHRVRSLVVVLDRPQWGNGPATECAEALTELSLELLAASWPPSATTRATGGRRPSSSVRRPGRRAARRRPTERHGPGRRGRRRVRLLGHPGTVSAGGRRGLSR